MDIYTIGHSSHSKELFDEMLKSRSIELLADVRACTGSRKWPQFSQDEFPDWLEAEGVAYGHCPKLGGRRRKSRDMEEDGNAGWRNQCFHIDADYRLTEGFQEGIEEVLEKAAVKRTADCCSQRPPARCLRLLISNYLTAN